MLAIKGNVINNNEKLILKFLRLLSQRLATKFSVPSLAKLIVENLTKIFDACWGSILIFDNCSKNYYPLFSNKHPSKDKKIFNIIIDKQSYIHEALEKREPIFTSLSEENTKKCKNKLRYKNIFGSFCIIPLFYNKKHLGILCLNRLPNQKPFTNSEVTFIKSFTYIISILLYKHLYLVELEKQKTDIKFLLKLSERLLSTNDFQKSLNKALKLTLNELELSSIALLQISLSNDKMHNQNKKILLNNFNSDNSNLEESNYTVISSVNISTNKIKKIFSTLSENVKKIITTQSLSIKDYNIDLNNYSFTFKDEQYYFIPIKNKNQLPFLLFFTFPINFQNPNGSRNLDYCLEKIYIIANYISYTLERFSLLNKITEEQALLLEYSIQNSIFLDISLDLASTLDPVNVLRKTFDRFIEIIDYTTISILLYDELERNYQLIIQPACKLPQKYLDYIKQNIIDIFSEYPSAVAIINNKNLIVEILHPQFTKKARIKDYSKLKYLYLPFIVDKKIIGMIHLTRYTSKPFSSKELMTTSQFTGIFITSIKNAFIHRKTEKLAYTDPLTGLYNHRYFQESLEDEVLRSKRYNKPLSLILIDVDYFKKFNDTYGHLVGDKVLVHCANIFKTTTREKIDIVARYGGEEFAITLPETKLEGAISLSERIRTTIEKTPIENNGKEIFITVSLGVASTSVTNINNKMELILAADKALYKAKMHGRNRTEAYTSSEVIDA